MNIIALCIAFAASMIITKLIPLLGIVDHPADRKVHAETIPQAGGLGFILPFIAVLAFMSFRQTFGMTAVVLIICTAYMGLVGLIDDVGNISARNKLILQLPVVIFSMAAGLMFDKCGVFFNILLTLLWYLGMMNAMNVLDGLDGLAGGISAVSCAGFAALGYMNGDRLLLYASLTLCAGNLGFLVFNFYPAKIFMGDTGSLALGYLMSAFGIMAYKSCASSPLDIGVPLLIIFIPTYNIFVCVAKRMLGGISLFTADDTQTYHLIMRQRGVSMRNTVLIFYAVNVLTALAAFVYMRLVIWQKFAAMAVIIALCVAATSVMGFLNKNANV